MGSVVAKTTMDLMTCGTRNTNEYPAPTSSTDRSDINSFDVEHIIEKSTLPVDGQYPSVDFVMSWALWNKANGKLFERKNRDPNVSENPANEAKKALYGEDIYNCVDSLLKTECDPLSNQGWASTSSNSCKDAVQTVTRMIQTFEVESVVPV
jgi:hypothetical protein